ncbi:MAG: 2Fe-2S iron-sulfur cluster binding domain-containing protein [Gammaproteobacteria bacterium]|nr:2Fe-2S iron-sulfur cluster binding domain-containing protein [Gammaproteobacteria bacterium]
MNQTVTIQPGGIEIEVLEGETVLEAGLRRGLSLPHSCRSGSCMACIATLTRGEVFYRHGPPLGLSEADKSAGRLLMCQAEAAGPLEIEAMTVAAAGVAALKRLPCRVEKLEKLCHDVMGLWLRLPPIGHLGFRAGQYLDFVLPDGDHRSFSIANPPHDADMLELHVRRVPNGAFSEFVFEELRPRQLLRMMGPLGNFYVRGESMRPLLMVAGGTGIAPIQSMLLDLVHRKDPRPVVLYWGVRARRDLYRHELLQALADANSGLKYVPVLSEPAESDNWSGRVGLVHEAVLDDHEELREFDVYLSGPPPMIDAARDAFSPRGMREERLYFDAFDFSPRVQAALESSG